MWCEHSTGWHLQQLTHAPATVANEYIINTPGPAAVGDVSVCAYDPGANPQLHFAYRDDNGNIQDVWYEHSTGWHLQQLTHAPATVANEYIINTPGPAAVGDVSVCAYNPGANPQLHFAYRDGNGNIQDVWYEHSTGWHLQKINSGTTWSRLSQSPGNSANAMWLMQDGTVLVCLLDGATLKLLHPDPQGSYANGSWSDAGKFLLAKQNFASAVLSDGRLVACGGEQSGPGLSNGDTNFCEIYDPRTSPSTVTPLPPPPGWGNIADAPSCVLTDGTFMLGNTQGLGSQVALLDPSTLTWTFGQGDSDNEQGYVLLQTGDVLTANVYHQRSMRYDPNSKAFVEDGTLPVMLGAGSEIGPGITLMDGRVIWFGASGHTCIYTPGAEGHNGTWVQGPDLPGQLIANDCSAILEPSGAVLLVAWSSVGSVVFLNYNPDQNTFALVDGAPATTNWEATKMLLLPNGHGLVSTVEEGLYDVMFSPGKGASWAPTIISFPATVTQNSTVKLAGTQLCGLSECQSFGDDNQQAENYPMVRFVDSKGGITYVRAHDVSTRSIAPRENATVLVDIPASLAPGKYSVQVVAMGIPSTPGTTVTVVR